MVPLEQSTVVGLQIGKVKRLGTLGASDFLDRPWRSGTFKSAVDGPLWVAKEGAQGDEQADMDNHGGPDKAVLFYSSDHFAEWEAELGISAMPGGSFGENVTVAGIQEPDVCIGDTYAIGEVTVQISEARWPCSKQSRRWRVRDMADRMEKTGRTGWYGRVLVSGPVHLGDRLQLLERPYPEWTVREAIRIIGQREEDPEEARRLASCPFLSEVWRRLLAKS